MKEFITYYIQSHCPADFVTELIAGLNGSPYGMHLAAIFREAYETDLERQKEEYYYTEQQKALVDEFLKAGF